MSIPYLAQPEQQQKLELSEGGIVYLVGAEYRVISYDLGVFV
ncbi:hypothetical protein [Nonomuraea sp. CA-141351]